MTVVPPSVQVVCLKRAKYVCERCKRYSSELTFHHKVPRELCAALRITNTNSLNNVEVLCKKCHSAKHPLLSLDEILFLRKLVLVSSNDEKLHVLPKLDIMLSNERARLERERILSLAQESSSKQVESGCEQ